MGLSHSCTTNLVFLFLQRLVVCLEESIYIHNIKDMKLLKTILDTPLNIKGKGPSLSEGGVERNVPSTGDLNAH